MITCGIVARMADFKFSFYPAGWLRRIMSFNYMKFDYTKFYYMKFNLMVTKPRYLLLSLLIILAGIYPVNAASAPVDPKVLHVINRISFGASPGDIEKVQGMGVKKYIQEQLSPESIPESQSLKNQLRQLHTLRLTPVQIYNKYEPRRRKKLSPEQRKKLRKQSRQVLQQATQAKLLRAIHSNRQLNEVMVDFWYNHFNVYAGKGKTRILVGAYEREAVRPYVFGRFRDLLEATARHPAMLIYLDNRLNTAPNSPGAKGRQKGLNENYARELMELHTLGVDGGYTQKDVITLARIFTGWGISRNPQHTKDGSGFYFHRRRHDFSDKVFLGKNIKGNGEAQGEEALDILASHPATARHISYKLAQYFVSDNPPDSLVKRLSQRFQATDGNIRAVLNTLLSSPEFWDAKNFNAKFKTPYQYVVSAVRATGIQVKNTKPLANTLKQLGMPLYKYPAPNGYKNTQKAWLNPDGMNRRLSFATILASGRLPLSKQLLNQDRKNNQATPRETIDAVQLTNTLGNSFSDKTRNVISSSPPRLRSALILGSPDLMRR